MDDGIEKLNPINPGEPIKITDNNPGQKKEKRHDPKAHEKFDKLLHEREKEIAGMEAPPEPKKKAKYKNGRRVL